MFGVWQRILPVTHPSRAQDPAHGRVAAQVSCLQPELQSTVELEDTPSHPHGYQTLSLCLLRKGLPTELRSAETQSDAQLEWHGRCIGDGNFNSCQCSIDQSTANQQRCSHSEYCQVIDILIREGEDEVNGDSYKNVQELFYKNNKL